jgi:hypothetical protein
MRWHGVGARCPCHERTSVHTGLLLGHRRGTGTRASLQDNQAGGAHKQRNRRAVEDKWRG